MLKSGAWFHHSLFSTCRVKISLNPAMKSSNIHSVILRWELDKPIIIFIKIIIAINRSQLRVPYNDHLSPCCPRADRFPLPGTSLYFSIDERVNNCGTSVITTLITTRISHCCHPVNEQFNSRIFIIRIFFIGYQYTFYLVWISSAANVKTGCCSLQFI